MNPELQAKPALRKHLRQQRQGLAPAFRARAATAAAALATGLPGWKMARHIAFYWPNDGELDPLPLAATCREQQRNLYLPVLAADNRLLFRRWVANATLAANRFGIPEPAPGSADIGADGLDIVFLPLVGWQRDGYRLGMGGGFYDRTLAGPGGPLKVGMGFNCQEIAGQLAEPWDVALDYILTETALRCCADTGCA